MHAYTDPYSLIEPIQVIINYIVHMHLYHTILFISNVYSFILYLVYYFILNYELFIYLT